MSNEYLNNTGTHNGNSCSLEKLHVNRSLKKNEEFAEEFHENLQMQSQIPTTSRKFNPNEQQRPVSERTAWN